MAAEILPYCITTSQNDDLVGWARDGLGLSGLGNDKGHSAADLGSRHLRNYCKSIFEFGSVIVNLKAMTFRMTDSLLSSFEVLSLASRQGYAFPAPVCLL